MSGFNETEYESYLARKAEAQCVASGSKPGLESYPTFNDQFFLVVMGALVFFMQAGFACLEAGSTGATSVTSILFKNLCDALLGAVVWWAVGYAIAYGDDFGNEFIGGTNFFLNDIGLCDYANWFYQWTFAATAVTIISGAMAGRTQLRAYLVYCLCITGFVYPVIVHWTWSDNGWLKRKGYSDFNGSGIVHCTGGMAALVGAIFVGPRGTDKFENHKKKADIPGHSMPLVALGTFILFFGFIGFKGGALLASNGPDALPALGLPVVNTVLAAAGGGLTAELINWLVVGRKYWSLMQMCNGSVAGMVAICAGANDVWPWSAFIIGIVGGTSYKAWSHTLDRLHIDDAIDAVAVHLGAGIWGVLSAPLFTRNKCVLSDSCDENDLHGIFFDGSKQEAWEKLGWAFVGIIAICTWTALFSVIIFAALKRFDSLRVPDSAIDGYGGLDYHEHGELAYVLPMLHKETKPINADLEKPLHMPGSSVGYCCRDVPMSQVKISSKHIMTRQVAAL